MTMLKTEVISVSPTQPEYCNCPISSNNDDVIWVLMILLWFYLHVYIQIFLHGNNLNSLHQLIHPEILPSEFGGMLPPYDMGTWARTLLDHEYDDDSECNADSYNAPAKDIEKDLSPKSMKRWVKGSVVF